MARIPLLKAIITLTLLSPAFSSPEKVYKAPSQQPIAVSSTDKAGNYTVAKDGWISTKICNEDYCIYANPSIANGRGVVLVTTSVDLQRIKRFQTSMDKPELNRFAEWEDPPFYREDTSDGGFRYVANRTIKRGTPLMAATPVLFVHKQFVDGTEDRTFEPEEQEELLQKAITFLPDTTRELFLTQIGPNPKSLSAIVRAHPFSNTLGHALDHSGGGAHYINYPEAAGFEHDCRPNTAFYLESTAAHRTTAARKINPGETLTITFLDPMAPRAERQESSRHWRGSPCRCSHCSAYGNLLALDESDNRLKEIHAIEKRLAEMDDRGITPAMLARLVELYKEERLDVRLADLYGQVALNYNMLGYLKRAKKFAQLAVQAGIIERGRNANDVTAMKIFLSDPMGHYSWQRRTKRKGV